MTDAQTPGTPETTPAVTAEQFVKEELAAAKGSLRNTQIFGTIIMLALSIYMITITTGFIKELQPDTAVKTVQGFAVAQIEQAGDAVLNEVSTRVPEMIQKAPDELIKYLPEVRKTAEQKFEEQLTQYCAQTSGQLDENLAKYIADNKEKIQAVIDASNDEGAAAELGPTLREEVMAYLEEPQADGKSVKGEIDESLAMLNEASRKMNLLAAGKNLTPEQKKTRRALAIVANTIDDAQLEKLDLSFFHDNMTGGAADDESAAPADGAKPAKMAAPATKPLAPKAMVNEEEPAPAKKAGASSAPTAQSAPAPKAADNVDDPAPAKKAGKK